MSYTIKFIYFDLGGLFSTGLPTLLGKLDTPSLGSASTASSIPNESVITFIEPTNPPGAPGSLLITDPAGPGDFFRSGPISTWPTEPVSIMAGTASLALTYANLSNSLAEKPIDKAIPGGITFAIGVATGFIFSPFHIKITSVTLFSSPTAGHVRASFRGIISFLTFFIPRRINFTGDIDMTLTPSGNAITPSSIVIVETSNLSISADQITPLSPPVLDMLAPLFSQALSVPLTDTINNMIADKAREMIPLHQDGVPIFSSSATVSIRRISELSKGLYVQAILSELVSSSSTGDPGTPNPPTGDDQFIVKIDPPPVLNVAKTYIISVQRESDGAMVEGAAVIIETYMPVTGASSSVSGFTDVNGVVTLDTVLRVRARIVHKPVDTGDIEITLPTLTVSKTNFQTYSIEL